MKNRGKSPILWEESVTFPEAGLARERRRLFDYLKILHISEMHFG
jgi:hypothetical protein